MKTSSSIRKNANSKSNVKKAEVKHKVLKLTSPGRGNAEKTLLSPLTLEMSFLLQSALDMEELIELLTKELVRRSLCSEVRYHHPKLEVHIPGGKNGQYQSRYSLMVDEEELGELICLRKTPFSGKNQMELEQILQGLLFPLRNAIKYAWVLRSALIDPLTGVSNYAELKLALKREVEFSKRHDLPFSVVMFDIDWLKRVNDQYGHHVGDEALKAFVQLLKDSIRISDTLARYGGDEFVVLLGKTNIQGAKRFVERAQEIIKKSQFKIDNARIKLTASIGIASLRTGEDSQIIMERVDRALYRAKQEGRNRACFDALS